MKIVTFNIRCQYDGKYDGINNFINRAGKIWSKIKAEQPEVVAFQEVTPQILELLKVIMPDYDFYGQGRLKGYTGEGLYTACRRDKINLISLDTFWMSDTPYVPESMLEGKKECCPRICVSTLLQNNETKEIFYVYNVHLDLNGSDVRTKELEVVFEKMAEHNKNVNAPCVLLGDFNAERGDNPREIELCREHLTELEGGFDYTFHGFGKEKKENIDYIFVSESLEEKFLGISLWKDEKDGIYLSDHYPVCAEFEF